MAEPRSFSNSTSWAGPTTREAEPIEKGEPESRSERDTERTTSEPSSLKITRPDSRGERQVKPKPIQQEPPKDITAYRAFRRLCDEIFNELGKIGPFLVGDEVSEEGAEVVAEVEALLEELYGCPYGQGESLKRVVVAIQSQVNNARWDRRHVEFLRDIARFLRVRYLVDGATVDACYEMMKARGLDPFRGTICTPRTVKRYRIEESPENDESTGTIL